MKRFGQTALLLLVIIAGNASADSAIDLTTYKGKVVVVDFWASWCVPCRRSFPWMNSMLEKYGDDGLVIIGVNMDSDPAESAAFLQQYPPRFQIVSDPHGNLARQYDVVAMPSSYIFGRDGRLRARHFGFKVRQQDEYEAVLIEALNAYGETL